MGVFDPALLFFIVWPFRVFTMYGIIKVGRAISDPAVILSLLEPFYRFLGFSPRLTGAGKAGYDREC